MLFVVGLYMVIGTAGSNRNKLERAVLLGTAAVTIWNVGAGLIAGLVLHHGLKRRWFLLYATLQEGTRPRSRCAASSRKPSPWLATVR